MDINIPLLITITIIILILVICILAISYSSNFPKEKKLQILKELRRIEEELYSRYFSARDIVVRLDSILSKTLQIRYNNNQTCGENLKLSKKILYKELYDKISLYHRLRNNIVHENIDIEPKDAHDAYKVYKSVIYKIMDK